MGRKVSKHAAILTLASLSLVGAAPAQATILERLKELCSTILDPASTKTTSSEFKLKVSMRVNDQAYVVQAVNSAVPDAPVYRLNELTRVHVYQEVFAKALTRIVLSGFPDATRVERSSTAAAGELLTDFSVPALNTDHVTIAVEISSDPNHVAHIERLRRSLSFKTKGSKLKVKSGEPYALAMTGNAQTGDFRFAGAGLTRALVVLPETATNVMVFRNKELIHGELGWLTVDELEPLMKEAFTDAKRTKLLRLFTESLPVGREMSAGELVHILGTMDWDEGRLNAIRMLKPRMTLSERVRARDEAARAMTFPDAKRTAKTLLTH